MFSKILIANRGEIAVRIIRACKEMGVATVAVYSEADRNALHVALADESYCIGRAEASESYLNENQIISTALLAGAQAIHPGYGFLSENAHFARLCRKNGIVFIGPDPEDMERLSDKAVLKELMRDAGLSVIPGSQAVASVSDAKRAASDIGYPVMMKACAGGGGRGIRLIRSEDELEDAYLQATAEAAAAFGDGSVYLEKYVFPARHIELQILADEHGHVISLGERDCSLQRRNQKLIEEGCVDEYVDYDELYARADLISLHAFLNKDSYHMINDESIAKMKDGVILINTGRGALVDSNALIRGIRSGKIGAAGLDVYEEENQNVYQDRGDQILGTSITARLCSFPNVVLTSHQAFFTREALSQIAQCTLDNAVAYANGGEYVQGSQVC
jgi:D-alanine-D-alanine ligase-like ATP-grasp enzyme